MFDGARGVGFFKVVGEGLEGFSGCRVLFGGCTSSLIL